MIKVRYNIIDGCEWSRSDKQYEKIFKSENDLQEYIESMGRGMYEINILSKEIIEEE